MLTDYENFHRTVNLVIAVVISLVIGLILGRQFSEKNLIRSYLADGIDEAAPLPRFYTDLPDLVDDVSPAVVMVESRVGGKQRRSSGFFISGAGHVATNYHAVSGAARVEVVLASNERLDAEVLETDPGADLAILKARGEDLPALELGDSISVRLGENILVFGSPLGLAQSVDDGLVSGLDRPVPGNESERRLQISAVIMKGNSGGPVVDVDGKVIGIITTAPEQYHDIGFATPVHRLRGLHDNLVMSGKIVYPWLGVRLLELDAELIERHSLKEKKGSFVETIEADSPGMKGGLAVGDVILAVDGERAPTPGELVRLLRAKPPNALVSLKLMRGSSLMELMIRLEPMPSRQYSHNIG